VEEARAVAFLDRLRATLSSGKFKKQDHIVERLLEEGFSSPDIASALIHQLLNQDSAPSSGKAPREREKEVVVDRPRVPTNLPRPIPPARPDPPTPAKAVVVPPPRLPETAKKTKSRRTPVEQTRLWMNVGEAMGILPIDVVNAVAGETGLSGKVVGTIDVRERHLFADVDTEHANVIIAHLNRSLLKGHKLKVKLA
jgi:ATP-dependent RNA helicase DeaD